MKGLHIFQFLFAAFLLLGAGCVHKDLRDEIPVKPSWRVQVVFDWTKAPYTNAQNMALYIYPENEGVINNWFSNITGGEIKLRSGAYTAVCHNNDNSYDLFVRNEHAHEELELYTDDVAALEGQGISTRSIPRAPGTEDEPIRATPPLCYGSHVRDINIVDSVELQTITLYPEELICRYTVLLYDVENLKNSDIRIDGSLSSLAGGYLPGKLMATSETVTHSFALNADASQRVMVSNFMTFGVPPGEPLPHMLSVYVLTKSRTGEQYTFDVSDQVNNAPDPRNVVIKVGGIKLPEMPDDPPDDPGGNKPDNGMVVDVEKWTSEYFTIPVTN